jgi:GNAT superfamily N-acetyltransferase
MIEIRTATVADAEGIARLLQVLGYPETQAFLAARIAQLVAHADAVLWVAVADEALVGVMSLHFIPQLALAGDICRISYFCVAQSGRGLGTGALLESQAVTVARQRGCDRMELHCNAHRVDAHRFYYRQGYVDSPKYLLKTLH